MCCHPLKSNLIEKIDWARVLHLRLLHVVLLDLNLVQVSHACHLWELQKKENKIEYMQNSVVKKHTFETNHLMPDCGGINRMKVWKRCDNWEWEQSNRLRSSYHWWVFFSHHAHSPFFVFLFWRCPMMMFSVFSVQYTLTYLRAQKHDFELQMLTRTTARLCSL